MRLQRLINVGWEITAALQTRNDEDSCPVIDFLEQQSGAYSGAVNGMYGFFERFSSGGPNAFTDAQCHLVDDQEKIWEFIKGPLRILWFYGGGNKIVVCSHGFVKSTQKTPKREIERARALKNLYERDAKLGQIAIVKVD